MDDFKGNKIERVLGIYTKLLDGKLVNKGEEALRYGVNERSIQRDIDDIRNFLGNNADAGCIETVIYDRIGKGYRMEHRQKLSNSEILALCKILLDSRAFTKAEMFHLLDRLVSCCAPRDNQKLVEELIGNEELHYIELQHRTPFLDTMWEIAKAIKNCQYLEIQYGKIKDKTVVKRKIQMRKKVAEWNTSKDIAGATAKGTIGDLCYKHLKYQVEHDELKPKSRDRRETTIKCHIEAYALGRMQVQAIGTSDIENILQSC